MPENLALFINNSYSRRVHKLLICPYKFCHQKCWRHLQKRLKLENPNLTSNQVHSKMENLKSSDYSAATKPDTRLLGGSTLRRSLVLMVNLSLLATSLHAVILGHLVISHVKPTGLNLIDPRLTVLALNPDASLLG